MEAVAEQPVPAATAAAPPATATPTAPPATATPTAPPATAAVTEEMVRNAMESGAVLAAALTGKPMATYIKPPSLLYLVGLVAVLAFVVFVLMEMSNYREIRRNWVHYRCNPSITAFASFYGHSLEETMNFCIGEAVKQHAPGVITPIYAGVQKTMGVVDGVYEKAQAVETGVASLLGGFETFVINFANSFRLVGTRVRMSIIRIRDIFTRVYGTFIAFAYAGISALTLGENLACNPLTCFVATIAGGDEPECCCFAPTTMVAMADGTHREIFRVKIGDELRGSGRVTSYYVFDGRETTMVNIAGIHVSANHYLRDHSDSMVRADAHPLALPAASRADLVCLGTTTNTIPIVAASGSIMEFADYEESEEPAVVAAAQAAAERALGNPNPGPPIADYSLGLDPMFQIPLRNGRSVPLADIVVGDLLENGSRVLGVIHEECQTVCCSPGGLWISAAQLVFQPEQGGWTRAARIWPAQQWQTQQQQSRILVHLLLTGGDGSFTAMDGRGVGFLKFRDYAEHADTQAPYDACLSTKK